MTIDLKLNRIDLMAAIEAHNKKCELLEQTEDMINIVSDTVEAKMESDMASRYRAMFDGRYFMYKSDLRAELAHLGFGGGISSKIANTGTHPENGVMFIINDEYTNNTIKYSVAFS